MIFTYILEFFASGLNVVLAWLPSVSVLPLGMDQALILGVGYIRAFGEIFPPVQVMYDAVFWYLFYFRLPLLLLRWFRIIR